jgi:antitoxin YefM
MHCISKVLLAGQDHRNPEAEARELPLSAVGLLDDMYRKAVRLISGDSAMAIETTYTSLRENLATFLDRVTDDREVVVVKRRRGQPDVAIIAADELSRLEETAYLLRSPANARRLAQALAESKANDKRKASGKPAAAALEELRRSAGL